MNSNLVNLIAVVRDALFSSNTGKSVAGSALSTKGNDNQEVKRIPVVRLPAMPRRAFCHSALSIFLIGVVAIGCTNLTSRLAGQTKPEPNVAKGTVLRADGKLISTIPGATVRIWIYGITNRGGENVRYEPKVSPDGIWRIPVASGAYDAPRAEVSVPFEGKVYTLPAIRKQGKEGAESSDKGIVADFVFQLTGPRPDRYYSGPPDPKRADYWLGAKTRAALRDTEIISGGLSEPLFADGTKLVYRFEPKGKLIDGSDATEVIERTFVYDSAKYPADEGGECGDLPPTSSYIVTAKEVLPTGKERPLLVAQMYGRESEKFSSSITLKLQERNSGEPYYENFVVKK